MATTTDDKYLSFAGLKVLWGKIKDLVTKKTTIAETSDIMALFTVKPTGGEGN